MKQQQQAQAGQRCHCEGIGFGSILQVKEIEKEGLRSKITTHLKIRFDAGVTRWRRLSEVELVNIPTALGDDPASK